MKRRKKSRRKPNSYIRYIVAGLIILSVVFLFLWSYLRTAFLVLAIPIGRGTPGSLEDKIDGMTLFTGGQHHIYAPLGGYMSLLVEEGQHVRAGDPIAEINTTSTSTLEDKLSIARTALSQYEANTEEEFNLLTSRIQSVYEEACRLFYLAQSGYMSRNLSDIRAAEKEFGAVMTDLADAKYRLAGMEEERGRLAQNVDLIEQVASTSIITVTAPVSGVFTTSYWQGFAQLTPENIGQKDASQIISIMNQIVKDGLTEVAAAQEVKQGDYMGMIITGEPVRCYMPVKTEDRPDIIAGQRAWISLPDGSNFDATVNSVVDGIPPGYSVISCDLEPVPTGRVFLAEQTSIINKRHSGILIPVKSLITREDGQQGVLLVSKTYARFTPVEVLMIKGKTAVVKGIQADDEIVLRAYGFLVDRRVR